MSRATSFASVTQQVSFSLGVAIGGLILQAAQALRGETHISQGDFAIAFWIVAAVGALSAVSFLRLPQGAGRELAGLPARTAAGRDVRAANPGPEARVSQ